MVGPSSLQVGTPCPGGRPPPLGLRGQETRQRWQSSQEGQRDQVEGGEPNLADHTDQEAPSRAHLGLLGGAVTMDWKLFYWANFIGVLLFFFNRKPKPHMSRPSIDCEGGVELCI